MENKIVRLIIILLLLLYCHQSPSNKHNAWNEKNRAGQHGVNIVIVQQLPTTLNEVILYFCTSYLRDSLLKNSPVPFFFKYILNLKYTKIHKVFKWWLRNDLATTNKKNWPVVLFLGLLLTHHICYWQNVWVQIIKNKDALMQDVIWGCCWWFMQGQHKVLFQINCQFVLLRI